ncbi:hypothetical protein Bbelb_383960 [Branchiostoma belcheri]|nr:hypothetical protein Bbelb_383960 [Branchiostoma belcheri]
MAATGKDMTDVGGGKTEATSDRESKKGGCCWLADRLPARYILAVIFFFAHIAMITSRGGFSIAIVVMVNRSSAATAANQTGTYQFCPSSGPTNSSDQNSQGELDWSESVKGVLLGANFYGYILTQRKLGGKIVYGTAMFLGAVLNVLSPVASRASPWAMFAVRFSMGLVSGVLFPTFYALWGRWAPATERTKLLAFCYIGLPLGTVINYPLSAFLAAELGWEAIFYIPGASVAVWLVFWLLLAYDSPAKHPRISEEEQKYIEGSTGLREQQKLKITKFCLTEPAVPWLKLLTSPAVWALVIGQFSSNWGVYFLTTQLPNYMQTVLGFNIRENGLLSALPFLLSMVSMLTSSFVADRLIQSGKIPKVWIRRGFVIIGFAGMATCGVILANLSGCDPVASVALLCTTQCFNGLTVAGFRAVHVEFAPRFSGMTFALANMGGTVAGIFAPLLVGLITDNDPTLAGWSTIFYIGAAIQGVGGIFTAVFMRTDVQPWARGGDDLELNIGEKDLVIANEFAEMPTKVVEMPNTKL